MDCCVDDCRYIWYTSHIKQPTQREMTMTNTINSSAINTYVVLITDTDGTFCELTTEAVNATVAVAEALALVNNSLTPWDVAEVTCMVVASNTSRGISVGKNKPTPVATPVG